MKVKKQLKSLGFQCACGCIEFCFDRQQIELQDDMIYVKAQCVKCGNEHFLTYGIVKQEASE